MAERRVVLHKDFIEKVWPGVFDHWVGEVVPVRGPDRRIVGEATVKSVDHREDGSVAVVVSSEIDLGSDNTDRIAEMMCGRESMSFKIQAPDPVVNLPHQPRRNDDVAKWLKAKRDEFAGDQRDWYWVIDQMLEEYRARADYGFTLDHDMSELEGRW